MRQAVSFSWSSSLIDGGRDPLNRRSCVGIRLAHECLRDSLDEAENCLVRRHDGRADEVDRASALLESIDDESNAVSDLLELAGPETGAVLLDEVHLADAIHASDARAEGPAETSGVSLCFGARVPLLDCPPRAELGARPDAELPVDPSEIRLDGLGAHECSLGDLPVRHPARSKLRDLPFARRELLRRTVPETDTIELGGRAFDPGRRTELLEHGERPTERVGRDQLLLCAPAEAPLDEEVAGDLERQGGVGLGFAEKCDGC